MQAYFDKFNNLNFSNFLQKNKNKNKHYIIIILIIMLSNKKRKSFYINSVFIIIFDLNKLHDKNIMCNFVIKYICNSIIIKYIIKQKKYLQLDFSPICSI